jgi:hypothetical protein
MFVDTEGVDAHYSDHSPLTANKKAPVVCNKVLYYGFYLKEGPSTGNFLIAIF